MAFVGIGISPNKCVKKTSLPYQIGSLVDSADFYNSANWSVIGSPSATFNTSSINFAATGPYFNFNNGIVFNPFISGRSKIRFYFDTVINSSTTGVNIGFRYYINNTNTGHFSALFGFNGDFGNGYISIHKDTTSYGSATYPVAPINGQTMRVFIEIDESLVKCSMQNITTGGVTTTVTANFIYTYPFTNPYQQNGYKLSINTLGGNFDVSNIHCDTSAFTQSYLVIGNSKTATAFPGSFANSFVGLLKAANPTKNIYYDASINETVNDWLARIADLKAYQPKLVFVVDCSNDLRFGVTNIATKHTQLIAEFASIGATCVFVNMFPETGRDARTTNTLLEPVYGASNVVDVYSLLVNPASIPNPQAIYITADGIHTSAAAQSVISGAMQTKIV